MPLTENLLYTDDLHNFQMINNYIYLYHVDKFIILPEYADSINDSMSANFANTPPLSRSAPIFSYTSSGPRTVSFKFTFHREMMKQINYGNSSLITDDYVDELIKQIQAAVLPAYSMAAKMVSPPIVAVRMGDDIFIKGIINGSLGLTYGLPILKNGKYAMVDISFTVTEIDPYDADTAMKAGSYRASATGNSTVGNLSVTLDRGINSALTSYGMSSLGETATDTKSSWVVGNENGGGGSTVHYSSSGAIHGGGGGTF